MVDRFETFTTLIARASRLVYKIKTTEMSEFGLKSSHVSCLYYIYKQQSVTANQLCKICGEDKANISRAISYLENNGYVYCQSDCKKRYQSPLMLTEYGLSVAEKVANKIDSILIKASEGLSEENRLVFYNSLQLICNNLENICSSKN